MVSKSIWVECVQRHLVARGSRYWSLFQFPQFISIPYYGVHRNCFAYILRPPEPLTSGSLYTRDKPTWVVKIYIAPDKEFRRCLELLISTFVVSSYPSSTISYSFFLWLKMIIWYKFVYVILHKFGRFESEVENKFAQTIFPRSVHKTAYIYIRFAFVIVAWVLNL